jgi:hypothetical protein
MSTSTSGAATSPGLGPRETSAAFSEQRLRGLVAASVFAGALGIRLARVASERFVGTWGDDFFYYLKIATSIVAGHGSKFDGATSTNGYHPLWMVCIITLVSLLGSGLALLVAVSAIIAGGCAATFYHAQRIAARVLNSDGIASYAVGLYTVVYYYKVVADGMEVILTVPLLLYFVWRTMSASEPASRPLPPLATGLLSAVVVLSRLDSVLFVLLFLAGFALSARLSLPRLARYAALFLVGFSPVLLYVAFNVATFGEVLPISGAAKQLKELPFTSLHLPVIYRYGKVFDGLMFYPSLALSLLALPLTLLNLRSRPVESLQAALPILLFPWLFYLVQMSLSDWPLWCWYLYPLVAAFPLAASLALCRLPLAHIERFFTAGAARLGKYPVLVLLVGAPLVATIAARVTPEGATPIFSFAAALAEFARTHPGRYAMGDRAGAVGLVLPYPVFQLEGLVEDRHLLERIRAHAPLRNVLKEYGVNYYVASGPEKNGSCYSVSEPAKGGPSSPKMTGEFCEAPVFTYQEAGALNVVFKLAE